MHFKLVNWSLNLFKTFFTFLICLFFIVLLPCYGILYIMKRYGRRNRNHKRIGIFHPYCNAGGGGERVLWVMLNALKTRFPDHQYVVYTGDNDVSKEDILKKAAKTFNIDTDLDIDFVFLNLRWLIEAKHYPRLTLLLQSLGSMFLAVEALFKFSPDVFIDTMGYSFTYPLFKYLSSCYVIAYVHFPTISVDMLDNVSSRREAVNNQAFIVQSSVLSSLKLIYYKIFARLYGLMGGRADITFVNSSWTRNHIEKLWGNERIHLVYPPCNTEVFQELPIEGKNKYQIVSISQFRPEKDHIKQIHSFSKLLDRLKPDESSKAKLVLIGSCRDKRDDDQVIKLRQLCETLNIFDKVNFALNLTFGELLDYLRSSNIGIHTMREEHFGIGIVELMAAGLIVVAHNSGGPKMDIICPHENGFLAETDDEYCDALLNIIKSDDHKLNLIRANARSHVTKFSERNFSSEIVKILADTLK